MSRHALHLACSTLVVAVLLAAVPSAARAERLGGGACDAAKPCKPFRPNQPPATQRPSVVLPKIHRPSATVTTWGIETAWQPVQYRANAETHTNRDPYSIAMTGYNEGSKVELKLQQQSAKVQLPESCPGCATLARESQASGPQVPRASTQLRNPDKWAKRERSKAWRGAVAQALRFEKLEGFQTTVASYKQTQTEQRANVLPTHTPYRVTGRDAFNRTYATQQGNAAGLATVEQGQVNRPASGGYTQYGNVTASGLHLPAYDVGANTNTQNLYLTPAYEKNGLVQTKLLGLAAFPAGAKVTVTNVRLQGEGAEGHSVSFVASRSGSGSVAVAGLQRDKLQVTVSFDGVANQAIAAAYTFNTRIPQVSGKEAFKARGVRYYGAALE